MSDIKPKDTKAPETPAAVAPEVVAPAPVVEPTTKRVIIQRPFGEKDSHKFFGFNEFGRQVQFDVPVYLPVGLINHLRYACKRVEYRADEKGNPVPTYTAAYSVIDAPA